MSVCPVLPAVVATLFALAGCADNSVGGASSARTPAPAAAPPAPAFPGRAPVAPDPSVASPGPSLAVPSGSPSALSAQSPESEVVEQTVTGRIVPGTRRNCRLLRAADGDYLLIIEPGENEALPTGERFTVTGWVQPDLMTTCMQGVPLVVSRIRPA